MKEEQIDQLKKPLPENAVASRKQGTVNLSYIEGYYAIDTANEIFGHGGWDTQIHDLRMVNEAVITKADKKPRYDVHYICIGRVIVGDTIYEDVGYGNGMSYNSAGESHELAVKEATTDCMKRCLRHFGSRFGNSLYAKGKPKTQPTAEEELPDVLKNNPPLKSKPSVKKKFDKLMKMSDEQIAIIAEIMLKTAELQPLDLNEKDFKMQRAIDIFSKYERWPDDANEVELCVEFINAMYGKVGKK